MKINAYSGDTTLTKVVTQIAVAMSILFVGFANANANANAPEKAADRHRYFPVGTATSDDSRRVAVPPGYGAPQGWLVLKGGRIFDGTGSAVYSGSIVIKQNKVAKILHEASTDWPEDARIIDVAGKTLMPGLIDLHTHLSYSVPGLSPADTLDSAAAALRGAERLRYYIESGITSVRDVASLGAVPFQLKKWVAGNLLPGPRVFPAGKIIVGTGGHGAEGLDIHAPLYGSVREASGPDDWREAVREQFKAGADLIKIGSHFSQAEIEAAVDEAHELGIRVTVDAESFYIERAVAAGADCIEHFFPRTDKTIRSMAKRGVHSVPTLITGQIFLDLAGGYYGSTSRRFEFSVDSGFETLKQMRRAGVVMGIGTDLVSDWFRYLPSPYIGELKWFVKAGYTLPEALVAATKQGAEILGIDDKLGTLEIGKLADVLVVDGQPDKNLEDLAKVDTVIRNGFVVVQDGSVVIERHMSRDMPPSR